MPLSTLFTETSSSLTSKIAGWKVQLFRPSPAIRSDEMQITNREPQPMPQVQAQAHAPGHGDDRRGRRRGVPSSPSSSRVDRRGSSSNSEFDPAYGEGEVKESECSITVGYATQNRTSTTSQPRCHTCSSIDNLEEDRDDPGAFYCKRCWDEYESATSFAEMPMEYTESREAPQSVLDAEQSALRQRLGVTPNTRGTILSRDASRGEKRTLRGHEMSEPKRRMSSAFDPAYEEGEVNESECSITVGYATQNRTSTTSQPRCHTCSSIDNLEEDRDDPGAFYCKRCWDEYESATSFAEMPMEYTETREAPQSVLEDRRMTIQCEPEPHQEQQPPPPNDRALWIVHDNPQLGNQVVAKGTNRMKCMLETKEPGKKNCVRIAIGIIDYSGPVSRSDIDGAAPFLTLRRVPNA